MRCEGLGLQGCKLEATQWQLNGGWTGKERPGMRVLETGYADIHIAGGIFCTYLYGDKRPKEDHSYFSNGNLATGKEFWTFQKKKKLVIER